MRRPHDLAADTRPRVVRLADAAADGGTVRTTAAHRCLEPAAAPTGGGVAFICDRAGVPQLWAAPSAGGSARLLDASPDPVTEVSWSPDGEWLAYTTAPGGGEHTRVLCVRPDGTERRAVAGAVPGQTAHLGAWRRKGSALAVTVAASQVRDPAYRGLAVFLLDPAGLADPELLTTQAHASSLRLCDFSPDGHLALLRCGPRGRRRATVLDTRTGTVATDLPAADGDPWIGRFSADGRTVWIRSDADREFAALHAARLTDEGSCTYVAVAAERNGSDLELLHVDDDGRNGVLVWNVDGRSEVEAVALGTSTVGVPSPVTISHEVVTKVTDPTDGGRLIAVSGSAGRSGVCAYPPSGGTAVMTPWSSRDTAALPGGHPPVRPEHLRFPARDGLPLDGWYYRPPGAERPGPCVVHLHGGPEWQERPVLNPMYQALTQLGIGVFAPNVRGSSGFGRSFVEADHGEGRFAAITDVADCTSYLILHGMADPNRVAVMGRSYGGYLALASLVWHPDLFRTGVAVCGISDFATFFAGTESWIAESAAAKYGHPEDDRDLLRRLSPMTRMDALRVPFLAVHGEHDTNVPPGESVQAVQAARGRGIPAELLVLRDEGHEFLRAGNRALYHRAVGEWLGRHLVPKPA